MAEVFCDLFVVDDDGIEREYWRNFYYVFSGIDRGPGLAISPQNGFVHEFYLRRDLRKVVNKAEEFIPLLSSYMAFVLFLKGIGRGLFHLACHYISVIRE